MLTRSAAAVMAAAIMAIVTPPAALTPSAWAAEYFVLPDGERAGRPIDLDETPYLREFIDHASLDSPVNEVAVMKCAQSAFTTGLLAAIGYKIDREPHDMMIVQPTDSALAEFSSKKFGRIIEAVGPLKAKVRGTVARSGEGSNTYVKRYGDKELTLAIASSSADLRSKTVRDCFLDEVDEYPADLEGQGDPIAMVDARQTNFKRSGTWKRFYVSTPTIADQSRIEQLWKAGDRRRWTLRCPHCGDDFQLDWQPGKTVAWDATVPHRARYYPSCCGVEIPGSMKRDLIRAGRWVPTHPEGRYPSYLFTGLDTPFLSWDDLVSSWLDAGDDPSKLKAWYNLKLGVPYEARGDSPDWQRLLTLREDYPQGIVPPQAVFLTAGCDVQHSGIWYEIVGWARDRQSWSIDHGFVEGDTTDPGAGAFAGLAALLARPLADSYGGARKIDIAMIDAGDGMRSNQVYQFTRTHAGIFSVKGVPGETAPACGVPVQVDVDWRGKRIKRGALLFPVGTWPLKATLYADLRKAGLAEGQPEDPAGYCHFHRGWDERAFKMLTSEYLASSVVAAGRRKGRVERGWKARGENHLLDCRVYAVAATHKLGLWALSDQAWQGYAAERTPKAPPDLFTPRPVAAPAAAPPVAEVAPAPPAARPVRPAANNNWFTRR